MANEVQDPAVLDTESIARNGSAITLTWTNEAPAMSAEQSTGLASAWVAVTNAPALTASNTWMIALPLAPGCSAWAYSDITNSAFSGPHTRSGPQLCDDRSWFPV